MRMPGRDRAPERFDRRRAEMVSRQLAARGIADLAVLAAMGEVPRERFVPEALVERAYDDGPLGIGGGQTISQPYIVARMSEALGRSAGRLIVRAAWLTYRMHRFEVVFVALLLAACAVGVWFISSQINDLGISATCWPRDVNYNYASPVCDALMERFWPLAGLAGYGRAGLAILPPIVGFILGVPIVAREIELRTTDLAWSLALRRSRWLLSRLLPMLALALVGFVMLGFLGSTLFTALAVGRESPSLTEVAAQGPTLLARGLMALGIAVLVGAIIGRTMPALLIAAVAVLVWSVVAVPTIQGRMFPDYAVWQSQDDQGWRDGRGPIGYVDYGNFDPSKPGVNGEPGARIDQDQFEPLMLQECGPYPAGDQESPERLAFDECNQQFYNGHEWSRVVPASAYPQFQFVDAVLSLAIGGAAILLTFPIVARRRPS